MIEREKPRYVVEIRKPGGRVLFYWQPNKRLREAGHLQRSLGPDRTTAFAKADEINAKLDQERADPPSPSSAKIGTMVWLIAQFEKDRRYTRLRPRTRLGYDQCMAIIAKTFGDVPVAQIRRKDLERYYNRMYAKTPWQANAVMRMFGRLLHVAVTYELIAINPATKMELVGCAPRQEVWEPEDLDYMRRMAVWLGRPSIAAATLLGAEIGQREGDILSLRWSQFDGEAIRLTQRKTEKPIFVRCTTELRQLLERTPKISTHIIVSEETNRPYTLHNFSHRFADIRDCAELGSLRFQDLRRTCVVTMARAGATVPQIAAVTGHEIDRVVDILETYLPRDSIMADAAIVRLEAWKRERGKQG